MSRYTPEQWIASVSEPDMAMEYMGSSPVHGMVFVQDGVEVLREVLADRDRLQSELQECKAELARVRSQLQDKEHNQ